MKISAQLDIQQRSSGKRYKKEIELSESLSTENNQSLKQMIQEYEPFQITEMYKDWQFWAALTLRHGRKQEAPVRVTSMEYTQKRQVKEKKKKR